MPLYKWAIKHSAPSFIAHQPANKMIVKWRINEQTRNPFLPFGGRECLEAREEFNLVQLNSIVHFVSMKTTRHTFIEICTPRRFVVQVPCSRKYFFHWFWSFIQVAVRNMIIDPQDDAVIIYITFLSSFPTVGTLFLTIANAKSIFDYLELLQNSKYRLRKWKYSINKRKRFI